jgi:cytochrome P450
LYVVLHSYRHSHLIDEDIVVATAMIFLVAGYDTTGLTLSYAAYHLAKNPGVQARLQADIDAAVADSDADLPDYSVIQSGLPYLEVNKCIIREVSQEEVAKA